MESFQNNGYCWRLSGNEFVSGTIAIERGNLTFTGFGVLFDSITGEIRANSVSSCGMLNNVSIKYTCSQC